MNLLDILIVSTLIYFVVKGVIRGFVREVASLAGVILGIVIASRYQAEVTKFIEQFLNPGPYLPLIGFVVVFAAVLVACNLLGWLIRMILRKAPLGWVDRILGLGFALLKGVVVTYLVIVILTFFLPSGTPLIARSKVAPWVILSYQSMLGLISKDHYESWKKRFMQKTEELTDKNPNRTEPAGKDGQR
jgi:membrane protein required for colicin V production